MVNNQFKPTLFLGINLNARIMNGTTLCVQLLDTNKILYSSFCQKKKKHKIGFFKFQFRLKGNIAQTRESSKKEKKSYFSCYRALYSRYEKAAVMSDGKVFSLPCIISLVVYIAF